MDFSVELIGHSRVYELENIIRAAFPGVNLNFSEQGNNRIISSLMGETSRTVIMMDGERAEGICTSTGQEPAFQKEGYLVNMSFLFAWMKLTKKELPWGGLIGIRPSKKVTQLWETGYTDEEIRRFFQEDLLVRPDKLQLMFQTAQSEWRIKKKLRPGAVSVYVGIPFCPTRCAYCSFISKTYRNAAILDEYLSCLKKELALMKDYPGIGIDSIYIGGGTPTTLSAHQLSELLYAIQESFQTKDLLEYTVEAGRPDTVTREKLQVLKDFGVNRVSINPQTLHDSTLKRIGRSHTAQQFYEAFQLAREIGFSVINTDLIAGLPGEEEKEFSETLEGIVALRPENITVHTLSIKRGADLTGEEEYASAEKMLSLAGTILKEYEPYYLYRQKNTLNNLENIGYTIKGFDGIYNHCMMGAVQSVLSFGGGGATQIIDQDKITKIRNPKDGDYYIKTIDQVITKKEVTLHEHFHFGAVK